MAKLTDRQRALRVTEFLLGTRYPGVTQALGRRGFDRAELAAGWKLVNGLTDDAFDVWETDGDSVGTLPPFQAWANEWLKVADVSLRARHPEAHQWLSRRPSERKGRELRALGFAPSADGAGKGEEQ